MAANPLKALGEYSRFVAAFLIPFFPIPLFPILRSHPLLAAYPGH